MKLKQCLSIFIAFGLALSSCDKKNASLVNRRTATPEKIEEVKRAKAKQEKRSTITETVAEPDPDIASVEETVADPKAAEGSGSPLLDEPALAEEPAAVEQANQKAVVTEPLLKGTSPAPATTIGLEPKNVQAAVPSTSASAPTSSSIASTSSTSPSSSSSSSSSNEAHEWRDALGVLVALQEAQSTQEVLLEALEEMSRGALEGLEEKKAWAALPGVLRNARGMQEELKALRRELQRAWETLIIALKAQEALGNVPSRMQEVLELKAQEALGELERAMQGKVLGALHNALEALEAQDALKVQKALQEARESWEKY
ncbi:hypothetical protein AGMMS50233_08010 [Endomicrobiia bacterium]|nr:hypothetical protein AGMMS50233_08010 [Endomicrobiia bacterium]